MTKGGGEHGMGMAGVEKSSKLGHFVKSAQFHMPHSIILIITFTESLSHGVLFQLPLCVSIQLHYNTKYVQQQSF